MIRRLIILLLIVGCEETLEPEDCAGVAGGNAYLNECGFCVLYGTHTNHVVCPECSDGYVLLWGECYNIEGTTNLYLWNNQLTGEIPSEIGNLTNLTQLYLHSNQLTGKIPPEIGNLTNLTYLNLSNNQLTGGIPPEIGQLTNLTYLKLHSNQLTGEIPSEIGNLTNLTYLSLRNNEFTGEIPQAVCDLIESNNLIMNYILDGNNLINTCP